MLLFFQAILIGGAVGVAWGLCFVVYEVWRVLAEVVTEVKADLSAGERERGTLPCKEPQSGRR